MRQLLQFAVLVLRAREARLRMVREQELEDRAAGLERAQRVRPDLDAVTRNRGRARRDEDLAGAADAGRLDEAETAGGGLVRRAAADVRAVAQRRDVDVQLIRRIKDGGAGRASS